MLCYVFSETFSCVKKNIFDVKKATVGLVTTVFTLEWICFQMYDVFVEIIVTVCINLFRQLVTHFMERQLF